MLSPPERAAIHLALDTLDAEQPRHIDADGIARWPDGEVIDFATRELPGRRVTLRAEFAFVALLILERLRPEAYRSLADQVVSEHVAKVGFGEANRDYRETVDRAIEHRNLAANFERLVCEYAQASQTND